MFNPGFWAAAFVNSLERKDEDAGEGIAALGALVPWVKSLPGAVFGTSAALKLETFIRNAVSKTGISSPEMETAIRFLVLMVRKNSIHHIDAVMNEAKKILNKKNGVVHVSAEYAFPPEDDIEERVKDAIKKQTGAARVELEAQINAELIGGYRLKVGDEIIDASVLAQLKNLEACLADGGY